MSKDLRLFNSDARSTNAFSLKMWHHERRTKLFFQWFKIYFPEALLQKNKNKKTINQRQICFVLSFYNEQKPDS